MIINLVRNWGNGDKFSSKAHDYFWSHEDKVNWVCVVWDSWSMSRYNFIIWLAILRKLRTKYRLQFMSLDPICPLCVQANEYHRHLFFDCYWSAQL